MTHASMKTAQSSQMEARGRIGMGYLEKGSATTPLVREPVLKKQLAGSWVWIGAQGLQSAQQISPTLPQHSH